MKRGVIAIFLLLTTLVFAEDSQIDETRKLRERVVKLEAIIERMEKEQSSSTNYYKEALQDSKEIYKGSVENNDKMLNHVYWAISGVFALLTAFLALIKWDNNKRLEKEKEEIKKDNERALKDLRAENKSLLDGVILMQEEIKKLEEKLQKSFEKEIDKHKEWVEEENKNLDEKIGKVDESLKTIAEQTKDIREKYIETKINAGISEALSKKTDEEKYEELKKLEESVKNDPDKFKEKLYFQVAYLSSNGNEELDYYSKVINLNKNNVLAYNNRGCFYVTNGDIEKAIPDYTKAIELDSKKSKYYNNRSSAYLKIGKYTEGILDCTRAIELNENDAVPYNNRAEAYLAIDKMDEALEDLLKHIKIDESKALAIDVSKDNYDKFIEFIERKENKTDLEEEVLRRFKAMEGITIVN